MPNKTIATDNKPLILAIDTSSENCSVALMLRDGSIDMVCKHAPRNHTLLILPLVKKLLADHDTEMPDLDGIAFGKGPGSFTGVRIAASIAQGLAFGSDKPVYGISSLEGLALQCYMQCQARYVLVAIDARMSEVYWGIFRIDVHVNEDGIEQHIVVNLATEAVCAPEALDLSKLDITEPVIGIGSGFEFFELFPEVTRRLITSFDVKAQPEAAPLVELAEQEIKAGAKGVLSDALPSYVRDTVTWKKLPGRE